MSEKSNLGPELLVDFLPQVDREERDALRRARATKLSLEQVTRALRELPQPSYEELAKRPVTKGAPFRL